MPSLAANLRFVENGKSNYSIVIAPDVSQSERHGAEELQKFLEEMSGARLPITAEPQPRMVLVGESPALDKLNLKIPFADLGPEGFALKTSGQQLVIAGGRLRGSMYGVYTFLEKLGCRWFAPEVSRIPKMRTITVGPLDETQKPAFE
jgi:alpha-glucuronidase